MLNILAKILLFVLLTVLTQIGGIVLVISEIITRFWKKEFRFKTVLVFLFTYLFFTFLVVPYAAPIFGREKIVHTKNIQPTMFLTDVLNRNYVRPELNSILKNTENQLAGTGIQLRYLDANFPFINGFPLFPHLSHNDGKKLDISLMYENKEGEVTNEKKSNSGYGVFEQPRKGEVDQNKICHKKGYFQYDYAKYLTLGRKNAELKYSNKYTKQLLRAVLKNDGIGKIFIEPHLKNRLNLNNGKIRFHGCQAVRHDDHIHLQLK